MTAIAAWMENGEVIIAGDTLGSDGYHHTNRHDTKVFRRGEFIIGFAGSYRFGQLTRFKLNVPAQREDQSDFAYMVTTFVDELRSVLKDNGARQEYKGEDHTGGVALVGYKGQLYFIDGDFHVGVPGDPYEAIGSGGMAARGALEALRDVEGITPRHKLYLALRAAEKHTMGVRGPFHVIHDDMDESELLGR